MAGGTITAAIIGAATAAATTAIDKITAPTTNGWIQAVIENLSFNPIHFHESAEPNHGQWKQSNIQNLSAVPDPQDWYEAWKASNKAPSGYNYPDNVEQLDKAHAMLLDLWISEYTALLSNQQKLVTSCELMSLGAGNGTEVAWCMFQKHTPQWVFILYMANRPLEDCKCGVWVLEHAAWQELAPKLDNNYTQAISHINDSYDDQCKMSTGGNLEVYTGDGYLAVNFTAGKQCTFTFKQLK